jgi:hypothetical protein
MARCMPGGDENSAQDVGRVIASADRIRRRNGAAVLLVHHTQKSGELERGSSALRGAADAMFALKNEDGLLTLECSKEKDAPEPPDTRLRLTPIGASCIVEPFEGSVPDVGLSRTRRAVLETIRDVQQDGWAATSVILRNAQAPGVRERAIYNALRWLRDLGYIEKKANRYALTTRGQEALGNCT